VFIRGRKVCPHLVVNVLVLKALKADVEELAKMPA
jgi:hypothetical protein